MEVVHRIREAIARGASVLTNREAEYIKQQTALLGEDGEAAMSRILERAKELTCQPADILKMVEDYCKDLNNRVAMRELSVDFEKGQEAERTAQLEAMEAEVSKLQLARAREDMAGIMKGRKTLLTQLEEYLKEIETDEDKGVTSDPSGRWRGAALDLTRDILQEVSGYGRDVASEKEDALGPLRRAMEKVASLNKAINGQKARRKKEACLIWVGNWVYVSIFFLSYGIIIHNSYLYITRDCIAWRFSPGGSPSA